MVIKEIAVVTMLNNYNFYGEDSVLSSFYSVFLKNIGPHHLIHSDRQNTYIAQIWLNCKTICLEI